LPAGKGQGAPPPPAQPSPIAACFARLAPEGCLLRVRVVPKAKRTGILGVSGDALKVAVAAPPEKGEANRELVELLATTFQVAKSRVQVVRGGSSRNKVVELALPGEAALQRLSSALE